MSVVLVASGCPQKEPPVARPPPPAVAHQLPLQWETMSFNGVAVVSSRGEDERSCEVRCVGRGGATMWMRNECIATRNDLHFVSPDCVVAVLKDAPPVKDSVAASPVGAVWKGNVDAPTLIRLHQVAAPESVALSESGKWFAWLKGTLDREGERPHYDTLGKGFEFDTLDGKHVLLTFAQLEEWVDRPPPPPPPPIAAPVAVKEPVPETPASDEMYRWTGADGVEQVGTADQIPEKYKKRAKRIDAELGVVKADKPPPSEVKPPRPSGYPAPLPAYGGLDKCAAARLKLDRIEKQLAELKPPPECIANPTVRTATGGWVFDAQERIRCTSGRENALKNIEYQKTQLEAQKAAAQEELRRAQVGGC
ncbi:MAG: hypothetical protein JNM17_37300 [Archangium sp.]|nr:hypothetical protein [Archangium sp.]